MIFLQLFACGKSASVFLEESEQSFDEEIIEESNEESMDNHAFELTIDTKPHHWIDTSILMTSSIHSTISDESAEPVWGINGSVQMA